MDSINSIVKQMPVSLEAEQALLGSLIVNPDSFDKVGGIISADDFYNDEYKHIYATLVKMYSESKTIDLVTLVNALVEAGFRDEASGIEAISAIAAAVPSAANIRDYARIVKDKSTLRRLIGICGEISETAYDEGAPVEKIIDSAEQKIFDLANGRDSKDFQHIRDVLRTVYQNIEFTSENKGAVSGVKTGFSMLDRTLVQMGKGDFIIVGARPGMGKTSFALNIATNVARANKAVAIFSLEMSAEQLVTRILSSEAMIDSHKIRTGKLSPEDWENMADAVTALSGCDIYIDDTSQIGTTEMKSKLRRINNLGLVVIDYIGLMQSNTNVDNRAAQVGEISRNLKIMAKEFEVPIVCCAQLNRGTETRGTANRKPSLADLRDSGSIEQDADIVLFLYREEYYKDIGGVKDDNAAADSANTAEIIVAKNRHGEVTTIKMGWNGQFTKFLTLEGDRKE